MKEKIKHYLLKSGKFLRLIDENNEISLTNVAFMVIILKVALVQDTSMTDIAALLTVILNYSYKKHIALKKPEKHSEKTDSRLSKLEKAFSKVEDNVGKLLLAAGFRGGRRSE